MRWVTFALILFLGGCGLAVNTYVASKNQSFLNQMPIGASREDVINNLGMPEKREVYGKTEFLLYRTRNEGIDEIAFTPVAIVDGKVVGFGRNYYVKTINADITVRQR